MTLSQEDHFILSKTISGIQEQVKRYNGYMEPDALEELEGLLAGLRDVVNELAGLKTDA